MQEPVQVTLTIEKSLISIRIYRIQAVYISHVHANNPLGIVQFRTRTTLYISDGYKTVQSFVIIPTSISCSWSIFEYLVRNLFGYRQFLFKGMVIVCVGKLSYRISLGPKLISTNLKIIYRES